MYEAAIDTRHGASCTCLCSRCQSDVSTSLFSLSSHLNFPAPSVPTQHLRSCCQQRHFPDGEFLLSHKSIVFNQHNWIPKTLMINDLCLFQSERYKQHYKVAKRLMKNKTCNIRTNIILRRSRETIVAKVKNNYYIFCVCMCVFVALGPYLACKQYSLYYIIICGRFGCTVFIYFLYYLKKNTIFGKSLLCIKSMFLFLYKFRLNRLDRPWGPPSLLYNGYRVFSGGKAAGAWR
jgi:hypothetical protein